GPARKKLTWETTSPTRPAVATLIAMMLSRRRRATRCSCTPCRARYKRRRSRSTRSCFGLLLLPANGPPTRRDCHENTSRRRQPCDLVSAAPHSIAGMSGAQGLFSGSTPLAVRMLPRCLDEVAGQTHLLPPGSPLVSLASSPAEQGAVSLILWGPPGTGKTTLAQAIAHSSGRRFVELSAVTAGVKDVREVMESSLTQRDLYGQSTVLFLDEIHRFTKSQQDALLPGVEHGWVILIAATTENPSFSVVAPLLSRSLLLTLQPLSDEDLGSLIDRA